jgi:hypothetical protein
MATLDPIDVAWRQQEMKSWMCWKKKEEEGEKERIRVRSANKAFC